jgi:hypothetical protein
MKTAMLWIAVIASAALLCYGQQTTTTHCNVYGSSADCTSNTTDNGAQQQRAYEQGRQVGDAVGKGMARAIEKRRYKSYTKNQCRASGGDLVHGRCLSDDDKIAEAKGDFLAKHRDFIRNYANAERMTAYLQQNRLDPRERKSYERAYEELKKAGQLELYAK